MSIDGKVWAVSKRTGQRVRVAEKLLTDPFWSRRYEEVVPVAEMVTEKSTHAQIDAFADAHHIDLTGATTRAEKVALIDAAVVEADEPGEPGETPQDPATTADDQSTNETPATGGQE
jgi:hypothetical protein